MRLIMKVVQKGSLGNFYCIADVGTTVVMGEFGANSKRLSEWLIIPDTMQKCDFSPEKSHKPTPTKSCVPMAIPRKTKASRRSTGKM
jgi:hypothetical protein